jgi:putative DNA primase/helicase
VLEYLDGLEWDGTERMDTLLFEGFGVEADGPFDDVIRLIARRLLLSMIARVRKPGCQADSMMVLHGAGGLKKSRTLEALAGTEWFSRTKLTIGDKDSFMQLRGRWLYEIAEMADVRRSDANATKQWLSDSVDTYRAPYARTVTANPRQTVLVGTVQEEQFLSDPTGNRRYWPVSCVRTLDTAWVQAHRDQVFAEASVAYAAGEPWWFEVGTSDAQRLAEMTSTYEIGDEWTVPVGKWVFVNRPKNFTVLDVCAKALTRMTGDTTRSDETRVGNILRKIGCIGKQAYVEGIRATYYNIPEALLATLPGVREVKTNPFALKP